MGILSEEKFKPTLFVGLGGHGSRIVDQLSARLRRHPRWDRIEALTHFLVLDTNKHDLDSNRAIRPDCRFLLSNFDARAYVERKRGARELPEDRGLTQWFPADYVPRSGMTPGAGQIRMESRLKLYYNLEEDRAGIRRRVRAMLDAMTARENPWRDNEDRVVRVMLYASVAGGTGSGGFLPMAWLLRRMVEQAGWGRPAVTGVLTLPTTFLGKVKPELHKDIAANGYAALKELEYLTRQLGYAGGADELEFHFDPGSLDHEGSFVHDRPFTLVYLIDRPDQISIDKYEHAVSDASYLQIFSPLLGAQASEYDNYEKHQRQLALGHFSVHYAAFGTALLHLPRADLLRYASGRFVARALREYLCFGGDHPDFRVPWGDPAFERLAEEEKARRVDAAFEGYVAWRAGIEEQADEAGIFRAIVDQKGKGGKPLRESLRERLAHIYGRLDELIDIPDVERQAINPGSPSISRAVGALRKAFGESRARVRGQYLEAQLADLRTGRFFQQIFTAAGVDPIAQRLFLIRLLREPFLTPFEDPEEGAFLAAETGGKVDLDSESVQTELGRLESELQRTAAPGLLQKVVDRENQAFQGVKQRAIRTVNDLAQDAREDLRRYFWRTFEAELRQVAGNLLGAYRKVAEISDEHARLTEAETERFRKDPASFPDSEVAQYYLDAEVLRDDRRRERLWHLFYAHHLSRGAYFDVQQIFPLVSEAFLPGRDADGTPRVRDAAEIVSSVKTKLGELGRGIYGRALEDLGLDLALGLDLEQRYIALLDAGVDLDALRQQGKLGDAVRGVAAAGVVRGVEDRLRRLADECVLLAYIDGTRRDDPTVVPASVLYAGLDARFDSDEVGSLGSVLRAVVSGINLVPGWLERDSLVLYRALLGVPVYWFKNVQSDLFPAYKKVSADPNRSYPLHIEATWESAPGLPNLDPLEIRRHREEAAAAAVALAQAGVRAGRVRAFSLCSLAGGVASTAEGYAWSLSGISGNLGLTRAAAFEAFEALDADLRADLEAAAHRFWTLGTADKRSAARLAEEVAALGVRLAAAHTAAVAAGDDRERLFLKEGRGAVAALLAELRGEA